MDQVTPPTSYTDDAKRAAIDQWTADPCEGVDGEPGSRSYFERVYPAGPNMIRALFGKAVTSAQL